MGHYLTKAAFICIHEYEHCRKTGSKLLFHFIYIILDIFLQLHKSENTVKSQKNKYISQFVNVKILIKCIKSGKLYICNYIKLCI